MIGVAIALHVIFFFAIPPEAMLSYCKLATHDSRGIAGQMILDIYCTGRVEIVGRKVPWKVQYACLVYVKAEA